MPAKSRPGETAQRATPGTNRGLSVAMRVPTGRGGGWLASAGPPRGAFPFVAPSWHPRCVRMARGTATPIGALPRWLGPCLEPTRPARSPPGSPEARVGQSVLGVQSASAPLRVLGPWPERAGVASWRAPQGRQMGPGAHGDRPLSPWASYAPLLARVALGSQLSTATPELEKTNPESAELCAAVAGDLVGGSGRPSIETWPPRRDLSPWSTGGGVPDTTISPFNNSKFQLSLRFQGV